MNRIICCEKDPEDLAEPMQNSLEFHRKVDYTTGSESKESLETPMKTGYGQKANY